MVRRTTTRHSGQESSRWRHTHKNNHPMSHNSTQRFSDRVENYIRYRPGYPDKVIQRLHREGILQPGDVVADIGSGTGILTHMLLQEGCTVYGIEPNREMRAAGERLLAGYPLFTSVDGTAEHTTLADHSVDIVTAAQAFHWFDRKEAGREFRRILKPGAPVVLLWNERRTDSTPFLQGYERLLMELATDYNEVNHMNISDAELRAFFPNGYRRFAFDNAQHFDFEGVLGRMLSSSYVPVEGPNHTLMIQRLRELFDACATDGTIAFEYDTAVYAGIP